MRTTLLLAAFLVLMPSAAAQATLAVGQSDSGYLDPGDRYRWTFQGQAGQDVHIDVTSLDFDPVAEVYGPDGSRVGRDDDSGEGHNACLRSLTLPRSGTYQLVVSGYSSQASGGYGVAIQRNGDRYPNRLTYGGSGTGTISRGGERDGWSFTGSAGDLVTISLDGTFDTYIELEGPDGETLTTNDDGGDGLNARLVGYRLPSSGAYAVIARGYSSSATGSYTVRLDRIPEAPLNRIQMNGSATGRIAQIGERDRWTFSGSAGDVVTISLTSSFDTVLELLGPDDRQLITNDDGGDGLDARIDRFPLPATGAYTIVARGYMNGTGAYTLRLDQAQRPPTQACGRTTADFGSLRVGSRVRLGRHRSVDGDSNWLAAMNRHVGRETTIRTLSGVDVAGCTMVRVDADNGEWAWRARDLTVVSY